MLTRFTNFIGSGISNILLYLICVLLCGVIGFLVAIFTEPIILAMGTVVASIVFIFLGAITGIILAKCITLVKTFFDWMMDKFDNDLTEKDIKRLNDLKKKTMKQIETLCKKIDEAIDSEICGIEKRIEEVMYGQSKNFFNKEKRSMRDQGFLKDLIRILSDPLNGRKLMISGTRRELENQADRTLDSANKKSMQYIEQYLKKDLRRTFKETNAKNTALLKSRFINNVKSSGKPLMEKFLRVDLIDSKNDSYITDEQLQRMVREFCVPFMFNNVEEYVIKYNEIMKAVKAKGGSLPKVLVEVVPNLDNSFIGKIRNFIHRKEFKEVDCSCMVSISCDTGGKHFLELLDNNYEDETRDWNDEKADIDITESTIGKHLESLQSDAICEAKNALGV